MQNKSFKMPGALENNQTIVQCPQCQTKFAVDGSMLAEVAAPRFHCSRCDFVFALELKGLSAARPVTTASVSPQIQPRLAANEPQGWTMGPPPVERGTGRGLEIPRDLEGMNKASAPHESHRDAIDYTQMKLDFKKTQEIDQSFAIQTFDEPSAFNIAPERKEQRGIANDPLPTLDYQRPTTRWTGLAYTSGPLIIFLSLLIGFSFYLRHNNQQAENLFASVTHTTAQVAPSDLNILNTKFKRLALDSGESAYLVSGSIKNSSTFTYREVKLEGLGFDDSGELVARTQVDAGATLAKTRIRSLSSDMIKNLQSGQIRNKVELKPGESEDFTFALIDGDPSRARYFSTRIYSVTY